MAINDVSKDIIDHIGDPDQLARDLDDYRKAAQSLSKSCPSLLEQYPEQWVAFYDGRVQAHDSNLESVMSQVDEKKLPRQHVLVRFIHREQRTVIL
jgi:hypothetical protein